MDGRRTGTRSRKGLWMSKSYSEKLLDPRWQKMRLLILQRDGFRCRSCESDTKTLHVHHCFYAPNREPWEYPESSLVTLCYECHEQEGTASGAVYSDASHVFRLHGRLHEETHSFTRCLDMLGDSGSLGDFMRHVIDAILAIDPDACDQLRSLLLKRIPDDLKKKPQA